MDVAVVDYQSSDAPKRFTESLRDTGFAVLTNHPVQYDMVQRLQNELVPQEELQKNLNQIQVSTQNGASLELVLLQVAAKCFRHPVEKLSLQTGPRDIAGWDSFQHIAFLGALEDQFSIRIPASLASGIRDLRTALNAVEICLQEKS